MAGEQRLIRVFEGGGDIHRRNAANIFRKKEEEVTGDERELAKRIVHASNYGVGPITFSRNAGVPVPEAKRLLNAYFSEYPAIKLWHLDMASKLRKSRTLTTPFGRKRTFFNRWADSLLREAYAYIPQSVVVEVINTGLRRLYEKVKQENLGIDILLQNHDALLCQVKTEEVQKAGEIIKGCLNVPVLVNHREYYIPTEISIGDNWYDLKKA